MWLQTSETEKNQKSLKYPGRQIMILVSYVWSIQAVRPNISQKYYNTPEYVRSAKKCHALGKCDRLKPFIESSMYRISRCDTHHCCNDTVAVWCIVPRWRREKISACWDGGGKKHWPAAATRSSINHPLPTTSYSTYQHTYYFLVYTCILHYRPRGAIAHFSVSC